MSTVTGPAPSRGRALDRLRASDVMTRDVVTVDVSASVREALALMQGLDVRHLPVMAGRRCTGVLDDRLAVFSLLSSASLAQALAQPVGDVVGGAVCTVTPGTTVGRVAQQMRSASCDAVVVVDSAGHLLGLLTSIDVVAVLARAQDEARPPS